mmetsp:Transcript_21959/g.43880  ORF Transcript_21959/g.43880 Transcript_21959/m.43880 type:complete len:214 (-) Transcript_21959:211-852(-)
MVDDGLGHEPPELDEGVPSLARVDHVVHCLLRDLGVSEACRVGPVHRLAALVEEVVVGVARVCGPLGIVVAAGVITPNILHVQGADEAVGQAGGELLANEVRRCLLLEPHRHSVSAARRANHVTVVVQDDVDARAICEVKDVVEALEEGGVQGVALRGLGTSPHHTEADGVPPHGLQMVHVGLVEGVARLAGSGGGAIRVDHVRTLRVTLDRG